jgi:meso-butanediol dehydrogenase/(S,S)-butanediol dehydrogenase/diacetyl reductase
MTNVLVTGAGSGIGAATARLLAARGYTVAVADIDADAAGVVADELSTFSVHIDVTDRASVKEAIAAAEKAIGPLENWVSDAGVSSMMTFLDISDEDWDYNVSTNAYGVFCCGQEFARSLVRDGRAGVIVNVASMAGKQGNVDFLAHYVASKFAVVGLTQAMAHELAPHHIRVNCVCPGFVATPMQEREVVWESRLRGVTEAEVRDSYVALTPFGRIETGEDVARVIAFLLGPDSMFITGEALAVNGGAYMD